VTQNDDALDRADREKRMIETRDWAIEQIAHSSKVRSLMTRTGASIDETVNALASSLARVERTLSRDPVSHDSRDLMIDDLIQRVDRMSRRIDSLELDIAALRSAQQPADPTGAHPYRSATQRLAVPASSPVVTSEALGRPKTRPSTLRRVYGALASRGVWFGGLACVAFGLWALHALQDTALAAMSAVAGICVWLFRSVAEELERAGAER
jgi:hypothetical protein